MCVCVCVSVRVCVDYAGWDVLLECTTVATSRERRLSQSIKHSAVARQGDKTVEYAKFTCDTCQRSRRRTQDITRHNKCQITWGTA